jgi:hypothetical protein
MLEIPVKFVSLKDVQNGTKWSGFYGGRFINKFGKLSFTMYTRDEDNQDVCYSFSYSADIKKKLMPNTGYITLTYQGMGFSGKFPTHKFDVECKVAPTNNPQVTKFLDTIREHTKSLGDPVKSDPNSSLFGEIDSKDPFSSLGRFNTKSDTDVSNKVNLAPTVDSSNPFDVPF